MIFLRTGHLAFYSCFAPSDVRSFPSLWIDVLRRSISSRLGQEAFARYYIPLFPRLLHSDHTIGTEK